MRFHDPLAKSQSETGPSVAFFLTPCSEERLKDKGELVLGNAHPSALWQLYSASKRHIATWELIYFFLFYYYFFSTKISKDASNYSGI
jgi:hypothetical protein